SRGGALYGRTVGGRVRRRLRYLHQPGLVPPNPESGTRRISNVRQSDQLSARAVRHSEGGGALRSPLSGGRYCRPRDPSRPAAAKGSRGDAQSRGGHGQRPPSPPLGRATKGGGIRLPFPLPEGSTPGTVQGTFSQSPPPPAHRGGGFLFFAVDTRRRD